MDGSWEFSEAVRRHVTRSGRGDVAGFRSIVWVRELHPRKARVPMASTARKRYEILVRTRVAPAALARLGIALTPTAVPAKTVHRLRVPADRDISDVVRTLTERGVPVLGVRRSLERLRPRPRAVEQRAPEAEVIVAFPSPAGSPSGRSGTSGTTARVLPLVRRTP